MIFDLFSGTPDLPLSKEDLKRVIALNLAQHEAKTAARNVKTDRRAKKLIRRINSALTRKFYGEPMWIMLGSKDDPARKAAVAFRDLGWRVDYYSPSSGYDGYSSPARIWIG
jgi:hypothetical protein